MKYTVPFVEEVYSPNLHKKHTLFCGTKVVQVKPTAGTKHVKSFQKFLIPQVLGVVIRTGFNTSKGQLFFSILFPKPIKFQFYSDSWKFLAIMICIAIGAFIWSAVHLHSLGVNLSFPLDVIFIVWRWRNCSFFFGSCNKYSIILFYLFLSCCTTCSSFSIDDWYWIRSCKITEAKNLLHKSSKSKLCRKNQLGIFIFFLMYLILS